MPEPGDPSPPRINCAVKLTEGISCFLLADDSLDPRLAPFARMVESAPRPECGSAESLWGDALSAIARGVPLWCHGAPGVGTERFAVALAARFDLQLLDIDTAAIADGQVRIALQRAVRSARLRGTALRISRAESLPPEAGLLRCLVGQSPPVVLCGTQPPSPEQRGVLCVLEVEAPNAAQRRREWQRAFERQGLVPDEPTLARLAQTLRLTPRQIETAAAASAARGDGDFLGAARAQCGEALASVATRVALLATWDDLVLPDDALQQLREICAGCGAPRVIEDWGFAGKLSRGRGIVALFCGARHGQDHGGRGLARRSASISTASISRAS